MPFSVCRGRKIIFPLSFYVLGRDPSPLNKRQIHGRKTNKFNTFIYLGDAQVDKYPMKWPKPSPYAHHLQLKKKEIWG